MTIKAFTAKSVRCLQYMFKIVQIKDYLILVKGLRRLLLL